MSQIDDLIAEFVTKLRAAIASEAAQAFAIAGGGGESHQPNPRRGKPGPKPKALAAKPAKRGKWQKRSPEELEALSKSLVSAIKKTPGQRSEHLAALLNTTTKDLALPLGALVTAGSVKTKGQRRGTSYFPGKG